MTINRVALQFFYSCAGAGLGHGLKELIDGARMGGPEAAAGFAPTQFDPRSPDADRDGGGPRAGSHLRKSDWRGAREVPLARTSARLKT